MRLLKALVEYVRGWLDSAAEHVDTDPLATALRPYEHVERSDAAFRSLHDDWLAHVRPDEPCSHAHATSLDHLDDDDAEKVWRCPACKLDFRVVRDGVKPWFISEVVPVVSDAAMAPMPPASVASDAHLHVELSDAEATT